MSHHHWRQRKTGPCHPLEVARCRVHGRAFTLYPPGHRPYGRQAVVPLAPDGSRLLDGEDASADPLEAAPRFAPRSPAVPCFPGRDSFAELAGGMFDAALDAAAGWAWPRCSGRYGDGGAECYWSSQGRMIERAMEVVGVNPVQGGEARSRIAEMLGVERMLLDEQAGAVRLAPGYRSRGRAVCAVLRAMAPGRQRCQRLLEGGRLAGSWGTPWYRTSPRGELVRMPFRGSGARDPPGSVHRPVTSTKVGR